MAGGLYDAHQMLIRKPADETPDSIESRSGHGAASVIPYMNRERQRRRESNPEEPGVDDVEVVEPAEPVMPAKLRWER
jgi:hypothetical protein